jgi:hypothetical protein
MESFMNNDEKAVKDPSNVDVQAKPNTAVEVDALRQAALGKISRRYAAYIVPAALAVLSSKASASPL